ncbi:uncharacterized protein CLUP02_08853 [Colletotrichum lupini]|uniref:Ubiquitin-like domain-containing protein n=1 Tax=Colletotrichum lupini TaxID=145971 RepID=A0A9Q8SUA3_9PEZI|nr:uncharacterized protein CLUP02_08853 [Colletotrichum lupini]UQC83358.1 hypothetical protein CLUP02_08853 [Colletotrichum lupini]
MSFGWSAGDIATALQLVNKVCIALKDAEGSKANYQDATAFLSTLSTTLRTLKDIQTISPHPELLQNMSNHVAHLMKEVDEFLQTLQNDYGDSLGPHPTSVRYMVFRKIQYAASTSNKVHDLRAKIGPELSTLQIQLIQHMIQIYTELPRDIQRQTEHATKTALEACSRNQENGRMLNLLESQGVKLDGFFEQNAKILFMFEQSRGQTPLQRSSLSANTQTTGESVVGECNSLETALSSISQDVRQMGGCIIGILKAVACLLSFAMMVGFRDIMVPISNSFIFARISSASCIKLIDALGREFTLSYDCAKSWDIFEKAIQVWFRGCPGMDLVRQGMYCVSDAMAPSILFDRESWSHRIKDGITIKMSAIVKTCTECGGRMSRRWDGKQAFWYVCPFQLSLRARCQTRGATEPELPNSNCNKPYLTIGSHPLARPAEERRRLDIDDY